VLLRVHLADDLVVAGPAEGLPIVVARQLVVLARSVLVARAVWGGPVTLHLTVPPEDKEALGVVDEDPVAAGQAAAGALTPMTSAAMQLPPSYGVITPAAAAAWGAQMAAQAQAAAAAQTAAATPTQTP